MRILAIWVWAFLVASCAVNPVDLAKKIDKGLKKEQDLYAALKKQETEDKKTFLSNLDRRKFLEKNSENIKSYIRIFSDFETAISPLYTKSNDEIEKLMSEAMQANPELKEKWSKLNVAIGALTQRNDHLSVVILPWAYDEIMELLLRINSVTKKESSYVLKFRERDLLELSRISLLSPPWNNNPFLCVDLTVDQRFHDTAQECTSEAEHLENPLCQKLAKRQCTHQMDMKCVKRSLDSYRHTVCTDEYAHNDSTQKQDEMLDSLFHCRSNDVVLN